MLLAGERYILVKGEKARRKFICTGIGTSMREIAEYESVHLRHDADSDVCIACNQRAFPWYDDQDIEKWSEHPRRCNYAYNPGVDNAVSA